MNAERLSLSVFVASCFLVGCGSAGDTSNVDVRMRAHANVLGPGGISTEEADDNAVQIASAHARVRDIELYVKDGIDCAEFDGVLDDDVECDDDEKFVIEGPFEVDLIAGTATPSLDDIALPEAVYDRVDIRIKDDDDDAAFEAVADVEGNEVAISLEFSEDARYEDDDGVELSPDVEALVVAFDADEWLSNVPLLSCIENGDVDEDGGTFVIDEDTSGSGGCSDVENEIKDNVRDSGRLETE